MNVDLPAAIMSLKDLVPSTANSRGDREENPQRDRHMLLICHSERGVCTRQNMKETSVVKQRRPVTNNYDNVVFGEINQGIVIVSAKRKLLSQHTNVRKVLFAEAQSRVIT